MKPDVISFDFSGTLAYETKSEGAVFRDILTGLSVEVDLQRLRKSLEEARGWWRRERARGVIWNESSQLDFVRKVLLEIGSTPRDDLAETIARIWPDALELKAYEDVKPTLEKLRDMGFRLILVSNVSSKSNLLKYVTRVGISEYFELLVASGSVGFEKPDSEIFLFACAAAGTDPERVMHVGDDYDKDYIGALRSGLKAVLVDRTGRYQGKTALKIKSLRELCDFISA